MSKKKNRPAAPTPESLGLPRTGVESHAHLDMADFAPDLGAVLDRAAASGVAAIGNVFLGPDAYEANKNLFDRHPEVFFILGIHPHDASGCTPGALARMEAAFKADPRLKALGETGLDFFYDHSPRDDQRRALADQLALARGLDIPVVIHSRDAHPETVAILLDQGFAHRPVLWHCFGGDAALAATLVGHGWHLSIPGPVTFPKSDALREAAASVPLDRLMLETDCPYLTPHPYRGKRNEPAYTVFTAQEVARVRGMDVAELWTACGNNARRFFGV
ncbi:MAG: TatD family hydrolase [Desulfovibrionaceae bacterium]